jgi:RNA ligase (TIGR02306 family)
MPWILEDQGEWEITQKLDGSSCTVFLNNGAFGVCSRNLELKETEGNSFWQVARGNDLEQRLAKLGINIAIQGELVGPGVQGNIHGLSKLDLYVFDIWLIDEQRYASPNERDQLMHTEALSGLKHVPLIEVGTLDHIRTLDAALSFADRVGDQINPSNKTPEGLVFKKMDGSESFKIISNRYLLKTGN